MVGGGQGELSADNTEDVLEAEMGDREALGGCPGSPGGRRWGTQVYSSPPQFGLCQIMGLTQGIFCDTQSSPR